MRTGRLPIIVLLLALGLGLGLASPVHADDVRDAFERGLAAQRGGNNSEALKEFRFAAEHGDPDAQGKLGILYMYGGRGIERDYVQAHMWLNLAVTNLIRGKERSAAVTNSMMVTNLMKPAQIAEAKKLAQEWTEAHKVAAK